MEKPTPFSIESYNELVVQAGTHVVQTRSTKPVRVICTDMKDPDTPVAGLIDMGEKESPHGFDATGRCETGFHESRAEYDLVIVPKPPVSLGWVAVYDAYNYQATTPLFDTAEQAISFCGVRKLLSEPIQIFAKP